MELFHGTIENANFEDTSFDVITMWWSLEHFHNPGSVLQRCRRLLKPDGLVVGGVPNFASLESKLFRGYCYNLDTPRHLSHFTPKTLRKLFQQNGFTIQGIYFDISAMVLIESIRYCLRAVNMKPEIMDFKPLQMVCAYTPVILAKLRCSSLITFVASLK
jgi:ubiquinone/menaquinone biosynthesis C-methylase UbiE